MGDTWNGNIKDTPGRGKKRSFEDLDLEKIEFIDFDALLKSTKLDVVAEKILEGALGETDFMKKDVVDRFLDFIYFKIQTGYMDIPHMAYPTKRMMDRVLEEKIMELINVHLYPEIVLRLMKFFSRNVHNPDSNLHMANLVTSMDIIRATYETFKLFKRDIFKSDPDRRSINVKSIQQFSSRSDNKLSSPLDQAAIYKYILEFFMIKFDVSAIYTKEDLLLSRIEE